MLRERRREDLRPTKKAAAAIPRPIAIVDAIAPRTWLVLDELL